MNHLLKTRNNVQVNSSHVYSHHSLTVFIIIIIINLFALRPKLSVHDICMLICTSLHDRYHNQTIHKKIMCYSFFSLKPVGGFLSKRRWRFLRQFQLSIFAKWGRECTNAKMHFASLISRRLSLSTILAIQCPR